MCSWVGELSVRRGAHSRGRPTGEVREEARQAFEQALTLDDSRADARTFLDLLRSPNRGVAGLGRERRDPRSRVSRVRMTDRSFFGMLPA